MIKIVFSLMVVSSVLFSTVAAQTKVIAHRGYWDYKGSAQNSIVALGKAHEIGAYGAEFDVSITADGIPVVNHDNSIQGYVIEDSQYSQLRDLRLSNGEVLPTLEQYLVVGRANQQTKLILEINPHSTKEKKDKAVSVIVGMVTDMQLENQVEYISFSMNICKEIIRLNPEAKVAYLKGDVSPSEIKEIGLAGIDYNYNVFNDRLQWIKECHDLGLTVNVWTVNDMELMREFVRLGVDFITTDKPLVLQQVINEVKK